MRHLHFLNALLVLLLLFSRPLSGQAPAWTSLSSGRVYAILCEDTSRVIIGSDAGIDMSFDGGRSWTRHGIGKAVHSLAVDPEGRLFAGAERGSIYVSSDDGLTWSVAGPLINGAVNTICVDSAGTMFASCDSYGIFASTDHGASWYQAAFPGITVLSVAVDSRNTLFAVRYGGGLYQSTNGGAEWIKTGLPSTTVRTFAIGLQDELFAGILNGGIWRSTDHGATWAPHGMSGTNVTLLSVSPQGTPFAGTSTALLSGTMDDTTWLPVSVPWNTQVFALKIVNDSTMFAATAAELFAAAGGGAWRQCLFDTRARTTNALLASTAGLIAASGNPGILRSGPNGFIWQLDDTSLVQREICALSYAPGGVLFAGTADAGVLVSHDSGMHWESTDFAANSPLVFALTADRNYQVFAGTLGDGVYASMDSGAQWSARNSGLGNMFVRALITDPAGQINAGTDGGLFVSSNFGMTWRSFPVLDGLIWCLVKDATGAIYAGTGDKGVYRSTNGGESWFPLNNGLTCMSVRSLTVDSTGRLFAGTLGGGVFQSTNGGLAWAPLNSGLRDLDIISLTVGPGDMLYAGTRQQWVFRIHLDHSTDVPDLALQAPRAVVLEQNYPNPFNPKTVVSSQLPVVSDVKLVIYDVLGREVALLVNERREAGRYQDTFDASGLASGVYIYRLTAGSHVESRQMILLR